MTADRSPDATADAAAVAGSGHLTDADREALAGVALEAAWAQFVRMPSSNPSDLSRHIVKVLAPGVEAIVARAVNEALTEAAVRFEAMRSSNPINGDGSTFVLGKAIHILDRLAGCAAPSAAATNWRAEHEAHEARRIAELNARRT